MNKQINAALLATLLALGLPAAHAGDRPFSALTTAAAEEDDDQVWSVDATIERLGAVRALGTQAEYAFNPTNSVQFGYGNARERGTGLKAQAVEIEYKHLFNHIARDGWGWGVSLAHTFVKGPGEGWQGGNWDLVLPFSLRTGDTTFLHANLGWSKSKGASSERLLAVGGETEIFRRVTLFGELAREGDATLLNVGVRHWLRKERWALDVSLQRAREDGTRSSGFVIGMSWYDL